MNRQIISDYSNEFRPIEKTLALIKPSGMQFREEILQKIYKANFKIIDMKICKLHPGQVSELFKFDWQSRHYPKFVESLTAGPIQAMCLARPNAIKAFRSIFGLDVGSDRKNWPCSIRACFGSIENDIANGLHGSANSDNARWEVQYFFPDVIITPVMTCPIVQRNYLNLRIYPKLFDGVYEIAKKRPHDPITELAHWLLNNNPSKPAVFNDQYDESTKHNSQIKSKNCNRFENAKYGTPCLL